MDKTRLSDDGKLQMYKDRRFGVDWGVGAQTSDATISEDDWRVSMDRMRDLCREGGLVFLPARNTPNVDGGLIGQVPTHADIELVDYETNNGSATMKTLKLHRVREVHPSDGTDVFDEVNYGHHTVHSLSKHGDKVVSTYLNLY
ncbi:hypothetical protein C472_00344 [Halorubrum tebenquichense DSM 14210]|uniref:Uncharacterized protein n=2 Tax=Halorubrum tebenquichense TaxID=119434 RepID=M0E233_9EURY|nr:hypothetical protein C472_00344 [Halorubrum tebenquichense DSM 14210]